MGSVGGGDVCNNTFPLLNPLSARIHSFRICRPITRFRVSELKPVQWFVKDEGVDQIIRKRFQSTLQQAQQGELAHWRANSSGRLAEIIVLDQFSRNIYRDQKESFQNDAQALTLSQEFAVGAAWSRINRPTENVRLYALHALRVSPHSRGSAKAFQSIGWEGAWIWTTTQGNHWSIWSLPSQICHPWSSKFARGGWFLTEARWILNQAKGSFFNLKQCIQKFITGSWNNRWCFFILPYRLHVAKLLPSKRSKKDYIKHNKIITIRKIMPRLSPTRSRGPQCIPPSDPPSSHSSHSLVVPDGDVFFQSRDRCFTKLN